MTKLAVIGFVTMATSAFLPASAQLLSYDEALDAVQGSWAVPWENETGQVILDCKHASIRIWFERNGDDLIYKSVAEGTTASEEQEPAVSKIQQAFSDDGRALPAILIQYEGETRQAPDGRPFQWRLFMPSRDSFVWQAAHWEPLNMTLVRTRCDEDDLVG